MLTKPSPLLFISHSNEDADWCRLFVSNLRVVGYDCFFDEDSIPGTTDWVKEIESGIKKCDLFILILTPASWASEWVQDERQLAESQRKKILVVHCINTPDVDGFLKIRQWIKALNLTPSIAAQHVTSELIKLGMTLNQNTFNDEPFIKRKDEVLIVPVNARWEISFTKEPSPAFREYVLTLPSTIIALGEVPEVAANRRLIEIGFNGGSQIFLGEIRPWSSYLYMRSFIFLAYDCILNKFTDERAGKIHIEIRSLRTWTMLMSQGKLLDARVISALQMATRYVKKMRNSAVLKGRR